MAKNTNDPIRDEDQDPQEALDEAEEEEEDVDPKALASKGLHIEGEEELPVDLDHLEDPEAVDPLRMPSAEDVLEGEDEDEDGIDLKDPEFEDGEEW